MLILTASTTRWWGMDWWVWPTIIGTALLVIAAFWIAETADDRDRPATLPTDVTPPRS